ncbi:MAG: GNAT family N-acetyltransferase [Blastocatellia bacterium]|nr:GNAT family N-acetyltransferase [Blastocatellia bacterium]
MKIRAATREDIPLLVEFNQKMARETEGKLLDPSILTEGVSAVFEDDSRGFYLVVEDTDSIVAGLMVTYEWSDWRNGWFWWIQSVYVISAMRGRQIYGQMYSKVKELAAAEGDVVGFRLYVETKNENAQRVYEKVGMSRSHYQMYEEEIEKPGT